MINNTKIILASSSESRRRILKNTNIWFGVVKPKDNETYYKKKLLKEKKTPKQISQSLSFLKANSVSIKMKNKYVVGADTVVSLNGKIINKAKNIKDAKKKIKKISGKKHQITSSAHLLYNSKIVWRCTQTSIISIRKLTKQDIDAYIKEAGRGVVKSAGCYQAEKSGPQIIEKIKGDFYNVLGFPLLEFVSYIKKKNL